MAATGQHFEIVIKGQPHLTQPEEFTRRPRISVDEALRFTPLTTSVLSAHDRIPFPQIGRAKPSAALTTAAERKSIHKSLDKQPLNEVKERLNILLNPDALAEIKFKQPPSVMLQDADQKPPSRPQLSPAARMVLDMTAVDYRYPTPVSPISHGSVSPKRHPQSNRPPTPAVSRSPENDTVVLASRRQEFIPKSPAYDPITSKHNCVIEIPPVPEGYFRSTVSPKRRKQAESKTPLLVRPQTELTKASLQQFQNLLLGLFEAHEALESHSLLTPHDSEYLEVFDGDDTGARIAKPVLERLQALAKQLVGSKAFGDVSIEHLRRLQQICEPAIESSQSLVLKVEIDPSEDELTQWRLRLAKAENGVWSANVFLWSILAEPRNKDLLPEDVIKRIPSVLINVFENIIIPVIESRSDGKNQELCRTAKEAREQLKGLLESAQKLLDVMATVCVETGDTEGVVNAVEFLAVKLIFVENAPNDKASVLGIQTYERVRKTAMGVVAKIYARFSAERPAVLREILHSLSKLPSTSRSARQYKTSDGKNVQLITALAMQLVQTTMLRVPKRSAETKASSLIGDDGDLLDSDDAENHPSSRRKQATQEEKIDLESPEQSPVEQLQGLAKPLFDDGARSASEIVNELVSKASTTTKTGEENYRTIFDFFVADLLSVLASPEWPAAELMLKLLAQRLIDIARSSRTSASAKNMALENLGEMGSAISAMQASLDRLHNIVTQEDESDMSRIISDHAHTQSQGALRAQELVDFTGPFEVVYGYLQQTNDENLRHKSARGCTLAHWSMLLCRVLSTSATSLRADGEEVKVDQDFQELVQTLLAQMTDATPVALLDDAPVSTAVARLAYSLIVLNSGFCRRLGEIVKTLSTSLGSDQAQVRSRSIKSVVSILETDSSLLDRDASIIDDVFACASDDSAMVRDSALGLIAKFIITRPALEQQGITCLLRCTADAKVAVQKRSMTYLKDIHLREDRQQLQTTIVATILRRLDDPEESVSELATKLLIEMWITPYIRKSVQSEPADSILGFQKLSLALVRVLASDSADMAPLVDQFVGIVLKAENLEAGQVRGLFASIVAQLFETIITVHDDGAENKYPYLIALRILAQQCPRTVTPDQLRALRPYLGNLTREDLHLFTPVVGVFRCALPHVPAIQRQLLQDIQDDLMKSVAKLRGRKELDEITSCLWSIDSALGNTEKLVRLATSVLKPLAELKTPTVEMLKRAPEAEQTKIKLLLERQKSYVRIIGSINKNWNMEPHLNSFRQRIPKLQSSSVAAFTANVIWPLTDVQYPIELRAIALEALGSVCHSSPEQFKNENIVRSFKRVFDETQAGTEAVVDLRAVVLLAFADILGTRETRKDATTHDKDDSAQPAIEKMGGDKTSQEADAAASQIAQRFFDEIVNAALGKGVAKAIIATGVIASINRQGLVHPKQCVGPLVALEMNPHKEISLIAHESHRSMHQQHESTFEREYLQAVREAYRYTRWTLEDTNGARRSPYESKLSKCFEVINTSSSKHVKKFLSNLVAGTKGELDRSRQSKETADQLLFCRFVAQNLAFFEYAKMDELLHTILQLEITFTKSGGDVVQGIESILQLTTGLPQASQPESADNYADSLEKRSGSTLAQAVNPQKLRELSTNAAILSILWETRSYLKRQYGIHQVVRHALQQYKQAKALDKAPSKVYGISADAFWNVLDDIASSLETDQAMIARCKIFVELMNVDTEVKVAGGDDEVRDISADMELDHEALKVPTGSGRGRKRKSTTTPSVGGTPTKKPRGRPKNDAPRRSSRSSTEDGDAEWEG